MRKNSFKVYNAQNVGFEFPNTPYKYQIPILINFEYPNTPYKYQTLILIN